MEIQSNNNFRTDCLFFIANEKSRFFIPHDNNLFNKHVFDYLMLDTGANTSLFKIKDEDDLKNIPINFKDSQFNISKSTVVGFENINLMLLSNYDIIYNIGNNYKGKITKMRFHLCGDDIKLILKENIFNLSIESLKTLKNYYEKFQNCNHIARRRKNCLIGQDFLKNKFLIQHQNIACLFDTPKNEEELIKNYKYVNEISINSKDLIKIEKTIFSTLEDDDHDNEAQYIGNDIFYDDYDENMLTI